RALRHLGYRPLRRAGLAPAADGRTGAPRHGRLGRWGDRAADPRGGQHPGDGPGRPLATRPRHPPAALRRPRLPPARRRCLASPPLPTGRDRGPPPRPEESTMTAVETGTTTAQCKAWHAEREEQLRRPHDWLSLTGFHWVPRSERPLPRLPGTWWADGDGLHVRAAAVEGARVLGPDGEPAAVLDGVASVTVGEAGSSRFLLTREDVLVEVVRRAGLYAVRV